MKRLFVLAALLAALLAGCTANGDDPTYYQDVQPIVQTYCVRCHFEGGLGAGDWTDADTVVALGETLVNAVEAGRMPPPASDPECRDYAGSHQLVMSAEAKTTLREWVDAGKPLGNPAEAVDGDPVAPTLADADTEFRMAAPYTPNFDDPNFPGNEYRCFVLPNDATEPFFVTGLSPLVDAQEIAHHIVISRIDKDAALPDHVAEEGFECSNFNILEDMLAGWAPGMAPVELPEGYGMRVAPDQNLIMQMHYYESDPTQTFSDQSGYAFRTTDAVDLNTLMIPLGSFNWTIPAGDDSFTDHGSVSLAGMGIPVDVDLFGVFPHMHVLGDSWRYWIEHDDGSTTCLSESDKYDFDNQMTYMWNDPPRVVGTDRIHFECTWNNSTSNPDRVYDEPRDTGFGEGTDEEMCFMFTYGAAAN